MVDQPTVRMTAAQFRQLPESGRLTELIQGEVIMLPSPSDVHQDLVLNIALLLRRIMPDGKTVIAPMDVYLDEINVVQPDIFWMRPDSQCVNRDGHYYGAPELVVEVHSPATITRDKREKFNLYQAYGVLEYWMIDPAGSYAEVWQRSGAQFARLGIFSAGETFTSLPAGIDVTLNDIFPAE